MESTKTKFSGYRTKIDGKVAYVVNETTTQRNVVFGRVVGYDGWNGGCNPVYAFDGERQWLPKSWILVFASPFDGATLTIIQETDKALQVRNDHCGRECWIPKSGLKLRNPGVETYENEYVLADWFRAKLNLQQEKVLNLAE